MESAHPLWGLGILALQVDPHSQEQQQHDDHPVDHQLGRTAPGRRSTLREVGVSEVGDAGSHDARQRRAEQEYERVPKPVLAGSNEDGAHDLGTGNHHKRHRKHCHESAHAAPSQRIARICVNTPQARSAGHASSSNNAVGLYRGLVVAAQRTL